MATATIIYEKSGNQKPYLVYGVGGQEDLEANNFDGNKARLKTAETFFRDAEGWDSKIVSITCENSL